MILFWNELPWHNIYLRLSTIQKKIFQATKKYKKNYIYRLQRYLLNSNEIKLISINYVTEAIKKCFSFSNSLINSRHIYIDDKQRNILLSLLFTHNIQNFDNLYFILEQVKQYMVYLCIQPEWLAKLDYGNSKNDHSDTIINKYFNYDKYITKFDSFNYIYKYMFYWIKNNYFIKNMYENMSIYPYISMYLLKKLCLNINYVSYDWDFFFVKQYYCQDIINNNDLTKFLDHQNEKKYLLYKNIIYYFDDNKYFSYKHISLIIIQVIKLIMYKKNYLDKWIIFNKYPLNTIVNRIKKKIYLFYDYNLILIKSQKWNSFLKLINTLIYYWQKKQSKCIHFFGSYDKNSCNTNYMLYTLEYRKYYYIENIRQ
uniref:Reverse transcriptase N-terminal domain-containing protein n=1 Tax=Sphondylothamnion multifidum TaxID=193186 RepID=A0A4D6X4T9_9FLOR|nr:hypothetical protein [Sphondylothamnion multifidum]